MKAQPRSGRPSRVVAAALLSTLTMVLAEEVRPVPDSGERVTIARPEVRVISWQPTIYHGWPTVAVTADDTLLLAYSGGRDYHVCPFGRIELMVSKDGGRSWSWPRIVADSFTDDRDTGLCVTKNGTLLVSFYTSIAYQQHMRAPERLLAGVLGPALDDTLARWRAAESGATQAERQADIGYWLARSVDRGRTWTARYKAPGYNPHGPIALEDGRVFYAAADGRKAAAWISSDDGVSWTHVGDLPTRAGELHAAEAGDGTLIVQVRDKIAIDGATKQRTLQTESRDGGRTWSKQRFVTDGYPPHLRRLKDNTLLLTYGSRTPPLGIRAKISRDHGQSWSREFLLTDDAPNWDLGYPSTAQLADGSLVTVWYEAPAKSHLAGLRQAKWRLPVK